MHPNPRKKKTNPYILIFESELNLIVANAAHWGAMETGGDLFGAFSHAGRPLIFLASPPGPNSVHEKAHFQQDPDYTRALSDTLGLTIGIQYIGNHHNHHILGLTRLSGNDVLSAQSFSRKNGYGRFCQLLVTFDLSPTSKLWFDDGRKAIKPASVTVHAFYYDNLPAGGPIPCAIRVLPGESPIRQALGNYRRNFELPLRSNSKMPAINYKRHQPITRSRGDNNFGIDNPDVFLGRIRKEIFPIPQKARDKIRFEQTGKFFLLCLPLDKTSNLVLGISLRPNWEIVSGYIGSTIPGCEPRDITQWILRQKRDQEIYKIYTNVRQRLRENRSKSKWPEDRTLTNNVTKEMGWIRKCLSFFCII